MKITIIGSGYVGLVTAVCFAKDGHDVMVLDVNQGKVDQLNLGNSPIYEEGIEALLARGLRTACLRFTTNIEEAVDHGDVLFIAVGTPTAHDGSADTTAVLAVASSIGKYIKANQFKIVVNKSTVPVGTAKSVQRAIASELPLRGIEDNSEYQFTVVSNPEFLKEGTAIRDFLRPDRVILGHDNTEAGTLAKTMMTELYAPITRNHDRILYMSNKEAEFTKYAANAMLATRISFMNELANLADKLTVDIEMVRKGIGSDPRIGNSFLYPGIGYGGSCFPKDVKALINTAHLYGVDLPVLEAVETVNAEQKLLLVKKVKAKYGPDLKGRKFAVWGLSFKPETDDVREAPAIEVVVGLLAAGASVALHDPVALLPFKDELRKLNVDFAQVSLYNNKYLTTKDVDGLLICTEWAEYRNPDVNVLNDNMKARVIFDGRNMLNPRQMYAHGFTYFGIGRRAV